MPDALLTVKDLRFGFDPERPVLDNINFRLRPGEILGLAGENGAGKTTLARLLAGELVPESGTIHRNPEFSPTVALVPQHPLLSPGLALWENLILGREQTKLLGNFSLTKILSRLNKAADTLGFSLDFRQKAAGLSASLLQKAALTGAFLPAPSLLILDEPTSSLPPGEAREFLETIGKISRDTCLSVIFISHRLEELFFLCDRIMVLRQGSVAAEVPKEDFSVPLLSELMVGSVLPPWEKAAVPDSQSPVILSIKNLTAAPRDRSGVKKFSLDLKAGEILGLAGIREEGLDQLEDMISGLKPWQSGSMVLNDIPLNPGQPKAARKQGLGYVPSDRMSRGSVPGASILENLMAHQAKNLSRGGILRDSHTLPFFWKLKKLMAFEGEPHQKLRELSGGNIQRLILTRELETNPDVLLLSEPSWGLDLGARRVLHDLLKDLRAQGRGILLLSSDLGELLDLCDRVGVVYGGELTSLKALNQWTASDLDKAILGVL